MRQARENAFTYGMFMKGLECQLALISDVYSPFKISQSLPPFVTKENKRTGEEFSYKIKTWACQSRANCVFSKFARPITKRGE